MLITVLRQARFCVDHITLAKGTSAGSATPARSVAAAALWAAKLAVKLVEDYGIASY